MSERPADESADDEAEVSADAAVEPDADVDADSDSDSDSDRGETASASATAKPTYDRPDRLDELLLDPPDLPLEGSLTSYRDGAILRRVIIAVLVLGVVAAVFIGRWYVHWLEERQRIPTPEYRLAEGAEGESRPDAIIWTDGPARLGISRQDPGVKAIVLPDRVITLAPGCDHAQVKVEVRNGKTVKLKVLVGEIRETQLSPEADPASPEPG